MFERCLFCSVPFRPNHVLTHLPAGRYVAYDPERHRLWVVCRRCGRWCLVPLELRWEAIHELESLRDQSHVDASTVGMARFVLKDLRVLRLGQASRRDEAWWRYGRDFRVRRYVRGPLFFAGMVAAASAAAVVAGGNAALVVPVGYATAVAVPLLARLARFLTFRGGFWAGELRCSKCGTRRASVGFWEFERVELALGRRGKAAVRLPCKSCDKWTLKLEWPESGHLLQRGLAQYHFFGGSKALLEHAVGLIEEAGTTYGYLRQLATRQERMRYFSAVELLALEMAIAEETEAQAGADTLEAQRGTWSEETELASIIDDELTPLPPPQPDPRPRSV